jgi:hypothetical protein
MIVGMFTLLSVLFILIDLDFQKKDYPLPVPIYRITQVPISYPQVAIRSIRINRIKLVSFSLTKQELLKGNAP